MEIRLKETEKLLAKAQKEREQAFVKLNEARKDIEIIHQIKKDVTHYERTIENLQKDLLTCQEEKRHIEKGYRDLQTKLSNAASKAEPSVENKKKREEEHSRKSSEVEQENEYLRLLLKHSVEEEKPSTSRTQIRHVRHSSVTPSRREASKIDSRSNSQLRINFKDVEFEPQPIPASTTRFEVFSFYNSLIL